MFRPAPRSLLLRPCRTLQWPVPTSRRTLFTASRPTIGSRFRSTAFRWTLAGGLIYFYMTSPVFADTTDERQPYISQAPPVHIIEEAKPKTIDEMREESKQRAKKRQEDQAEMQEKSEQRAKRMQKDADGAPTTETEKLLNEETTPEALEEEAEQQGAFNEETGEINWDCPCLGGMAFGPCGEEFRTAFTCFVYSKDEPKGINCVGHFKTMQTCFAQFPEIYGSSDPDDDDVDDDDESEEKVGSLNKGSDDTSKDPSSPHTSAEPTSDKKGGNKPSQPVPSGGAGSGAGKPGSPGISNTPHPAPVDSGDVTGLSHPAPGDKGTSGLGLGHPAPGGKTGAQPGLPQPRLS